MLMEQEKHRMMEPLFDYDVMGGQPALVGNGLTGMDILSVDQFDKAKIDYIFARAREMREMVEIVGAADLVKGNVLACIFYEPSTRTSSSFIAAMERLGVLSFRLPVVCNSVRSAKEKRCRTRCAH